MVQTDASLTERKSTADSKLRFVLYAVEETLVFRHVALSPIDSYDPLSITWYECQKRQSLRKNVD